MVKLMLAVSLVICSVAPKVAGGKVESPMAADPQAGRSENSSGDEFADRIRPLLERYCLECHENGNMKGLDFFEARTGDELAELRDIYRCVVEQLETNAMPPDGTDHPSDAERKMIVDWLRKALDLKQSDTERLAPYVVASFEDTNGNLWFGTISRGALRYDGKSLTWFTTNEGLPSNTVTSFAQDKAGVVWLGSHGGIGRFDGDSFRPFGADEGIPAGGGNAFVDRKGGVWANMDRAVYRLENGKFAEFKVPLEVTENTPYAIFNGSPALNLHDRDGNFWFGTDGYGVFRYDGKSFTQFTKKDGLSSNTVNDILQDKRGNIWFACMQAFQPGPTGDGGLCCFDGTKFTTFAEIKGLNQNDIYTILETRGGDIWIGATGVGAYRYDGKTFKLFSETDRKAWTRNFGLQAMMEDRKGNLWCGFSGGLFRFDGEKFTNVTESDLSDSGSR